MKLKYYRIINTNFILENKFVKFNKPKITFYFLKLKYLI